MTQERTGGVVLALEAMLAAHPEAWVGALSPTARYVPVPGAVPLTGHRLLHGRWVLELVHADDRVKLADMWRARTALGTTSGDVTLATGGPATFHIFDTDEDLGASIVVVLAEGADLETAMRTPAAATTSRFCRILRDEIGRTIEIDNAAPAVLGYSAEDLLSQRPPLERIHPDDHAVMLDNWMATLANETDGHRCRVRVVRPDGSQAWFELTNFNRLDDPIRPHVVSEMLDISEEMAAHEAVAAREQLLHRLAEALPLGVLQVDPDRRVVYRNDYLGEILGASEATTMEEQFVSVVEDDRRLLDKAFSVALDDGADDDVIIRLKSPRRRGEQLVRVITKSLHAANGDISGVIACVSDVTEATLMGRELERRATFDALTGCFNRASILGRLSSALADGGFDVAALFIDLDGFKEINDTEGHAAGDEHLKTTARLLIESVRPSDVVGRLGGDEFLVVCQDVGGPEAALGLAERVASILLQSVRTSIGVAWAAAGTVDADHLVHRADEAMYASKREGECRPHLWQS
jgi:diguanylate cyclase (GGDEF)-like protein/PAS domain S-box-containing protein